ncbi:hypothetical protein AMK22_05430 [Streptomyces sp. CB01580]|nr:hypothetical protein AMK22_05430 [Streptomyces sp. CB01580]
MGGTLSSYGTTRCYRGVPPAARRARPGPDARACVPGPTPGSAPACTRAARTAVDGCLRRPRPRPGSPASERRAQIPGPVRRSTRSESVTDTSVNAPEASARR